MNPNDNSFKQYGEANETLAEDERINLYYRFKNGLMEKYGLTIEDLIERDFCLVGGTTTSARNAFLHIYTLQDFNNTFGTQDKCVCDVQIKRKYLVESEVSSEKLIIGRCCAKHFLKHGCKLKRKCIECGKQHTNHILYICNECKELKREKDRAFKTETKEKKMTDNKPFKNNKHIVNNKKMTETYELMISYDEKDDVKALGYPIVFNKEIKKWEYTGVELPEELEEYLCKDISIPFKCKDEFKKLYNIYWNTNKKTWQCSAKTIDIINGN
jgi:hypothetical protein